MRKTRNISSELDVHNLLVAFIANQERIFEEFNLLHQRMDRLEGGGVLPPQERKSFETLFTSKEVTSMLKISVRTLFTLRKNGEIDITPMGKSVRFSSEQIQAYKRKQAIIN